MAVLAVSGASGIVGKRLVQVAEAAGHEVRVLTHGGSTTAPRRFRFAVSEILSGQAQAIAAGKEAVEGVDALINLSGSSIGEGRLTDKRKQRILSSRIDATTALGTLVAQAKRKPKRWVQISAVGYYGNAGEAVCDEATPPGHDFLADVCVAWERAAAAQRQGVPLVIGRLGLVVDRDADAWRKLLLPVRLGIGGPMGRGKQWQAWIVARDVARALSFLALETSATGVFNLVAPQATRQLEMVEAIARKLHRPSFVRTPEVVLRLALGELADVLLLSSCRVSAEKLLHAGFHFEMPLLAQAIQEHVS